MWWCIRYATSCFYSLLGNLCTSRPRNYVADMMCIDVILLSQLSHYYNKPFSIQKSSHYFMSWTFAAALSRRGESIFLFIMLAALSGYSYRMIYWYIRKQNHIAAGIFLVLCILIDYVSTTWNIDPNGRPFSKTLIRVSSLFFFHHQMLQ